MKRKRCAVFAVVLMILTSCNTTLSIKKTNTPQQNTEALEIAAEEITKKTFHNFSTQVITGSDFIPDRYRILEVTGKQIVGLNVLLKLWREHISSAVDLRVNDFHRWMTEKMSTMDFSDSNEFIRNGKRSISDTFTSNFDKDLTFQINLLLKDVDFSYFEDCIVQYNAYCLTHDTEETSLLSNVNFKELFIGIIKNSFITILSDTEEFYRTTPDPYMQPVVARLFNLE